MDTEKLYDKNAGAWQRREPNSLSDFTGRPAVFELCGDVSGHRVVDLGCGEGYCARELAQRGASVIEGIELSEEMVDLARAQESELGQGNRYRQGDVRDLPFDNDDFDLALGVFVYNYLHVQDMVTSFREVFRVLKPGGHFVFSVPHPAFPFIRREQTAPFHFDFSGHGYFTGRDARHEGNIYGRDGRKMPVQMIHKSLEDYFDGLTTAGFTAMPVLRELRVRDEHLESDPEFFGPVADLPLHLAFKIRKQGL